MSKVKWIGALMLIMPFFVAYAYTFQVGYFSDVVGMSFSQNNNLLYTSTGMGFNDTAFLMDQRLGVEFCLGKNVRFFLRGGGDVSLVIAYNATTGILFAFFGGVGIKYEHWEISIGLYKGIKALNYSGQIVNFEKHFPEAEIGYSW